MADQLLSQADVDALVASLSKNDPPKPAAPAVKPPAPAPIPVASKPAAATPAARPSAPPPFNMAVPALKSTSAPVKAEVNNEVINGLNSKIAELSKQLNNMSAALKRMEMLEKKVGELESKTSKNSGAAGTDQKVQQLTDEMRKIVTNLKGTPGYGVRNTFSCEKCDDHGHVALQFRCTKCGHERWYGWWPEKKK
jgi:hypothetical protein